MTHSDPSALPAEPAGDAGPARPVAAAERIVALDFIRGIAVLGIVLPNIVAFGHPMLAYYWPEGLPGGSSAFDRWTWLVQIVLVDGKLRGLFTLLFGAGMVLFLERVEARGGSAWLQPRRLLFLALFGLAHTFLVWPGDILLLYACAGFVALLMLRWPAATQLVTGAIWFVAGAIMFALLFGVPAQLEADGSLAQPYLQEYVRDLTFGRQAEAADEVAVITQGSLPAIVAWRWGDVAPSLFEQTLTFASLETVPLMLVGMGLYRVGFFAGRFDPRRMRRWGWAGVVGGAALTLPLGIWVMQAGFPLLLTEFVFNGAAAIFHLPMIVGLAALLAAWAPSASTGWLGIRLVAAGRMAFSNYLGTSLVMMFVFQGWAGGLFGQLHRAELLVVVLLAWALMLAWSKPWLARFRYGPLEWLWRCLTYGRMFPLRRTPQSADG